MLRRSPSWSRRGIIRNLPALFKTPFVRGSVRRTGSSTSFRGRLTDETDRRPALFGVEGEKAWPPFVYNFRFCLPRSQQQKNIRNLQVPPGFGYLNSMGQST